MADDNPDQIKARHKGRLHRALGIAEDSKIPIKVLKRAVNSKSPRLRKMATYALNALHWDN